MGWHDALMPYRASDDPLGFLGAALLAQDQTLFKLAATWPRIAKSLPPVPEPGEEIDLADVWKKVTFDYEEWGELSQVPSMTVVRCFKILKGNRIIFPDGSLSHQAEAVIKRGAAAQFMAATGITNKDLK